MDVPHSVVYIQTHQMNFTIFISRSDKSAFVNLFIPTQIPEENQVSTTVTRLTTHFTCYLMSDLVVCKHHQEYGHTQHQVCGLGSDVIKQHKTKQNKIF